MTKDQKIIRAKAGVLELGARIGVTSVLHTWGSALTHHPHVHMIVPGGGISLARGQQVSAHLRLRRAQHTLPISRTVRPRGKEQGILEGRDLG